VRAEDVGDFGVEEGEEGGAGEPVKIRRRQSKKKKKR
jgi:hypothetical protein